MQHFYFLTHKITDFVTVTTHEQQTLIDACVVIKQSLKFDICQYLTKKWTKKVSCELLSISSPNIEQFLKINSPAYSVKN